MIKGIAENIYTDWLKAKELSVWIFCCSKWDWAHFKKKKGRRGDAQLYASCTDDLLVFCSKMSSSPCLLTSASGQHLLPGRAKAAVFTQRRQKLLDCAVIKLHKYSYSSPQCLVSWKLNFKGYFMEAAEILMQHLFIVLQWTENWNHILQITCSVMSLCFLIVFSSKVLLQYCFS